MTSKIIIPVRCPHCVYKFKVRVLMGTGLAVQTVECPSCHQKSEVADEGGYFLKPKINSVQEQPSSFTVKEFIMWSALSVVGAFCFMLYYVFEEGAERDEEWKERQAVEAARIIAEPSFTFESKDQFDWDVAKSWCENTPNAKENGTIYYKVEGGSYGRGCWSVYDRLDYLKIRKELLAELVAFNPKVAMRLCEIRLYPFPRRGNVLYVEDLPKIEKWLTQEENRNHVCLQTANNNNYDALNKMINDAFPEKSIHPRILDLLENDNSVPNHLKWASSKSIDAANKTLEENLKKWDNYVTKEINPALREGRRVMREVAAIEAAEEAKIQAKKYAREHPIQIGPKNDMEQFANELSQAAEKYLYAPQRKKAAQQAREISFLADQYKKIPTLQSRQVGKNKTTEGKNVEYPSFKQNKNNNESCSGPPKASFCSPDTPKPCSACSAYADWKSAWDNKCSSKKADFSQRYQKWKSTQTPTCVARYEGSSRGPVRTKGK